MQIIEEYQTGDRIAYLKQQDDQRYTINSGIIYDSGFDTWYSTEATTLEIAKQIFQDFIEIKYNTPKLDAEDIEYKLFDIDINSLDSEEIENYE
jgi:hypothetical protein